MSYQKVLITDDRVSESSGLAHGVLYPDLVYTLNDEPGPIYAIEKTTGNVVGVCTLQGVTLKDSECLDIREDGVMWVSDSGDNNLDKSSYSVYVFREPGRGTKTVTAEKYLFKTPHGPKNLESFCIRPSDDKAMRHRYWISKELPKSRLYRSKVGALLPDKVNTLEYLAGYLPGNTSDVCFSVDGRWVFLRQKDWPVTISVLNGQTWKWLEDIPCPRTEKGESICADPDGKTVWIGSEGDDSPLIPVTLPEEYQAGYIPPPLEYPANVLPMTNWKYTKPDATEVLQPALATYQNDKSFRVGEHRGERCVFFRADCDAGHTENSSYPRSETREMKNGGRDKASWSTYLGTHSFFGRLAITHRPNGKPHVVVFQIHDAADDVIMVRLEGTKLFVESPYAADQVLNSNYQLGDIFTIECKVSAGIIEVTYNGTKTVKVAKRATGCYFKYGMYTQATSHVDEDDDRYGTGYGESAYMDAEEKHAA